MRRYAIADFTIVKTLINEDPVMLSTKQSVGIGGRD